MRFWRGAPISSATSPGARVLLRAWAAEGGVLLGMLRRPHEFIRAALARETLADVALRNATLRPGGLALQCSERRWSHVMLAERFGGLATRLKRLGVQPGQPVPVVAGEPLEAVAALLAVQWIGAVPVLLDARRGPAGVAEALDAVGATVRLLAGEDDPAIVTEVGRGAKGVLVTESVPQHLGGEPPRSQWFQAPPRAEPHEDAAWLQTSGTTGQPKLSRVRQTRVLFGGVAFARLVYRFRRGDKLLSSMNPCHAAGLTVGLAPALMSATPLAFTGQFSARRFWAEAKEANATVWLGIGEMCRWLLHQPTSAAERDHRVRLLVSMGLDAEVEVECRRRFAIPAITEFYGASDGPLALVRFGGPAGTVGRIPRLAERHLVLARYDADKEDLAMNEVGFAQKAAPGELGELLIRQPLVPGLGLGSFEGYAGCDGSHGERIRRSVFTAGDVYYRSFDLMLKDSQGFLSIVGRAGECIRYRGLNLAAPRVAATLMIPGVVRDCVLYGVRVPAIDGTPPSLAVVWEGEANMEALVARMARLRPGDRPCFLRFVAGIERTLTLRPRRMQLQRDGVDPTVISDPLFIWRGCGYVPLDSALYQAVTRGEVRL